MNIINVLLLLFDVILDSIDLNSDRIIFVFENQSSYLF